MVEKKEKDFNDIASEAINAVKVINQKFDNLLSKKDLKPSCETKRILP